MMEHKALQWSPQQLALYNWVETGRGSAIAEAVAGAGKTTALVEVLQRIDKMSKQRGRRVSVAFAAYNRAISEEIKTRVGALPGVRVSTFHGFGYGAWLKAAPSCSKEPDDKKLLKLLTATEVPENFHSFCQKAVSLAKGHAIGVLTPFDNQEAWHHLVRYYELEETLSVDPLLLSDSTLAEIVQQGLVYAQKLLQASIAANKDVIDYDDMIYAPLIHNVKMWQNDWVLVDEAQDTNPARRAMARKMLLPNGRLIAVGDPHQAIYGFTGADADALDLVEKEFNCVRLPLHITYRCPKAVVAHAQQWVSHIQAGETAPAGEVHEISLSDFDERCATGKPRSLKTQDVVLCRNMKPLVEIAYRLIKRGVPCHVEGRDIGRGLVALALKWKIKSLVKLTEKLREYREKEVRRLLAKNQEQRAQSVEDQVDTLLVMAEPLLLQTGTTVEDLKAAINKLFGDTEPGQKSPNLTLSTVHKSKGREWETVYLFGRNAYMPSKYARQQWQLEQEKNLMYVAVTRAKNTLVEVRV